MSVTNFLACYHCSCVLVFAATMSVNSLLIQDYMFSACDNVFFLHTMHINFYRHKHLLVLYTFQTSHLQTSSSTTTGNGHCGVQSEQGGGMDATVQPTTENEGQTFSADYISNVKHLANDKESPGTNV